jgi:hypothetical protein
MRAVPRCLALAAAASLPCLAAPEPALVDLSDYPPYYDALMHTVKGVGVTGVSAIPGLSVIDHGVRVMPVKVSVTGRLSQLVTLVERLHGSFPFAHRVGDLTLAPGPPGGGPFALEIMLLSPVKPAEGAAPGTELETRLVEDRRHARVVDDLLAGLAGSADVARWLRTVRIDDGQVGIEGAVPEGTSAEGVVARVLGLPGVVVAEVIGPQTDPESGQELFLATGRLDVRRAPAAAPAPPPSAAPTGGQG